MGPRITPVMVAKNGRHNGEDLGSSMNSGNPSPTHVGNITNAVTNPMNGSAEMGSPRVLNVPSHFDNKEDDKKRQRMPINQDIHVAKSVRKIKDTARKIKDTAGPIIPYSLSVIFWNKW